MFDPLICAPEEKAQLEVDNGVEQLQYLDYLVTRLGVDEVRESHVLKLQELAVASIFPCGGKYRDALKKVGIQNSDHVLPEAAVVPIRVREALDWINGKKGERSALERAAYALWRFNWIHPFAGGNGRTSRCLAYLIVCMDLKAMIPGEPTMPTIISHRRDEYIDVLRAADASASGDDFDLSPMTEFLKDALMRQMAHAVDAVDKQPR